MDPEKPGYIDSLKVTELSFDSLRQEGIDLLQQLSGSLWTDYNLHDPGVTILEHLCFAITDLSFRADFPIEEILTEDDGKINYLNNSFLDKKKILSSAPVTINDFKKIILDEFAKEIDNVWLEAVGSLVPNNYLNGIFTVKIKLKKEWYETHVNDAEGSIDILKGQITRKLNQHRSICEDFGAVTILEPQKIKIAAEIIIKDNNIAEDILAEINKKIVATLNPGLTFHKEHDLVLNGYKINDIYTGPLLKNGIIIDEELKPLKEFIDASEILEALKSVDNVSYVKWLKFSENGKEVSFCTRKSDSFFYLDDSTFETDIKLISSNYKHSINSATYMSFLKKKSDTHKKARVKQRKDLQKIEEKFTYKNIAEYFSIQDLFPNIYGIGKEGLEPGASNARRAAAKQLKAYLMLFEQLMANHLSQLDNIKKYFSVHNHGTKIQGTPYTPPSYNVPGLKTLYGQPLYNVPGVQDILKAYDTGSWEAFKSRPNDYVNKNQEYLESPEEYKRRKNIVLDHLLARFNETLSNYPIFSFNKTYTLAQSKDQDEEILNYKSNYFKLLEDFGLFRTSNSSHPLREHFTWLELRMLHLLNIKYCRLDPDTYNFEFLQVSEKKKKLTESLEIKRNREITSSHTEDTSKYSFTFSNRELDFFKDSIKIENYVIDEHNSLLYKPGPPDKQTIQNFDTPQHAHDSRNNLVKYMTELNINSEGFHIVEHVLLAPDLNSESFGFNYSNLPEKHLSLPELQNLSFGDREKIIKYNLFYNRYDDLNLSPEDKKKVIKYIMYYKLYITNQVSAENKKDAIKNIIHNDFHSNHKFSTEDRALALKYGEEYNNDTDAKVSLDDSEKALDDILGNEENTLVINDYTSEIKLFVTLPDHKTVISEDFFNLQMTVVLPSWPARFQNEDFKKFIKKTFLLNIPAHIRINFEWLNIAKMHTFETNFFHWQKTDHAKRYTDDSSGYLINLLAKKYVIKETKDDEDNPHHS